LESWYGQAAAFKRREKCRLVRGCFAAAIAKIHDAALVPATRIQAIGRAVKTLATFADSGAFEQTATGRARVNFAFAKNPIRSRDDLVADHVWKSARPAERPL